MIFAYETDMHWGVGYISGTFDMFHAGHLNLIRRARERCDRLIVGVLSDKAAMKSKKKLPVRPLRERMEIVAAIRYVDEVDITTRSLLKKVNAWEKYRFDAMFSGDDHANESWTKEHEQLKLLGAELVFFSYTEGISSSALKERLLRTEPFLE